MNDRKEAKDSLYDEHPYGKNSVLDTVSEYNKYHDKDVLVAGCGAGDKVFELLLYGANITAIDQSETSIEFIRQQCAEMDVEPPELITGDLTDYSFPKDEYDYVICRGVLHHTIAPGKILAEFSKTCKEGGEVEIMVYNSHSFVRLERKFMQQILDVIPLDNLLSEERKEKLSWWDKYRNPLWDTYTAREVIQLVETNGLNIQDAYYSGDVFGTISERYVPLAIKRQLKKRAARRRWHIEIRATPKRIA